VILIVFESATDADTGAVRLTVAEMQKDTDAEVVIVWRTDGVAVELSDVLKLSDVVAVVDCVIEVVSNAFDGEAGEDAERDEKFDAVGEEVVEGDHVPLEVVEIDEVVESVPVADGELVSEVVIDKVTVFELVAEIVCVAEVVYVPEPVCEIVPVAQEDDVGDIV
jgi:hypothetical protein